MQLTLKEALAYYWQHIVDKFVAKNDTISNEEIDAICGQVIQVKILSLL